MDMRRTHGCPFLCPQQVSRGGVNGDRITGRFHRADEVVAVFVRNKFATQIEVGLVLVLVLVKSIRGCLPDIKRCPGNGFTIHVQYTALQNQRVSRRGGPCDGVAKLAVRCRSPIEGAKQG